MTNLISRIPRRYWAYLALSVWAALCFLLLNKSVYGIDEGAAQALILVWSVSDNVVSPIVTLGIPDFRALFLAPVGILWTGSVLAAKIMTMGIVALSVWLIQAWRQRSGESESALIATGLLLISPLLIHHVDTISVAPFLLVTFVLGAWADLNYRASKRLFGGLYFAQIFLCLVSVTLHPMGLAYPLALAGSWYKEPLDTQHRNSFFIGIGIAVLMALTLTAGWNHMNWLANPVTALSSLIQGPPGNGVIENGSWFGGLVAIGLLCSMLWLQVRSLLADMLGRSLLFALLIGMWVGDGSFAVIALTLCLYWGLPLILPNAGTNRGGFWQQRGWVLVAFMLIATTYMSLDRATYQVSASHALRSRDILIKTFAEDSGLFLNEETGSGDTPRNRLHIASQWPALTILACRCDALPLPPDAPSSDAQFALLRGIDYLIFDPRNPDNAALAHNLSSLDISKIETIDLQQGGVIIRVKHLAAEAATGAKP